MFCAQWDGFWTPRPVYFRCLGFLSLFPPSLLTSHWVWHPSGSSPMCFVSYFWPRTIDVIFPGFLFRSSLHSLPVCQLLTLSNHPVPIHCQLSPRWELGSLTHTDNALVRISFIIWLLSRSWTLRMRTLSWGWPSVGLTGSRVLEDFVGQRLWKPTQGFPPLDRFYMSNQLLLC